MEGHVPHTLDHLPFVLKGEVYHYTCNPPSYESLLEHGVNPIGNFFGCADSREVLQVPVSSCEEEGIDPSGERSLIILEIEKYLRKIDS